MKSEGRRRGNVFCLKVFATIRVSFYAIEREKEEEEEEEEEKKKNVGRDTKGNSPFVCE